MALSGNLAFVAAGTAGLLIYDISNPLLPSLLNAGLEFGDGFGSGVAVAGNYAYLANGDDGLRVYDVSDPAHPSNIGHSTDYHGLANSLGVAVTNNFAYVANELLGLSFYDVSVPNRPTNIFQINDGGSAEGLAVAGNYVYLANWNDGLRVYLIVPQLNIIRTNNSVLFSWSIAAANYQLQQAPYTTSTNWTTLTNTPTRVGDQYHVTIAPPSGTSYYRLVLP